MKHYITEMAFDLNGPVPGKSFKAAIFDTATSCVDFMDGRADLTLPGGTVMVSLNPSPAEHAAIIADSRNTYIGQT